MGNCCGPTLNHLVERRSAVERWPRMNGQQQDRMSNEAAYPYKKVDHKKYIKGQVDLLGHIPRPLLALFDSLTEMSQKSNKSSRLHCRTSINRAIDRSSKDGGRTRRLPGCIDEVNDE
jgi:hypothetical protein